VIKIDHNQKKIKSERVHRPYRPHLQGKPSLGIFTSLPVSEIRGGYRKNPFCDVYFAHVASSTGFTGTFVLHENIYTKQLIALLLLLLLLLLEEEEEEEEELVTDV